MASNLSLAQAMLDKGDFDIDIYDIKNKQAEFEKTAARVRKNLGERKKVDSLLANIGKKVAPKVRTTFSGLNEDTFGR